MLDVIVKTLDSQNHSYSVPDEITVKEFKEKIAASVNIPADKQRLIFCGRVLQDEKKLLEYDVNGKVIHLVQRPPPQSHTSSTTTSSSSSSSTTTTSTRSSGHSGRDSGSFLLQAFTIPQDRIDPADVQQIIQEVVSGMGDIGRNATVMSRTSEDGSSVDVHINLGGVPLPSEAQRRINQAQTMINRANQVLDSLENGSTNNGSSDLPMQTDQGTESEIQENAQNDTTTDNIAATVEESLAAGLSSIFGVGGTNDNQVPGITIITSQGNDTPTTRSNNSDSTSNNATTGTAPRYGEGLAQAARAAVAAAVAAAAGAAAAAARVATSTAGFSQGSTGLDTQASNSNRQEERTNAQGTGDPLQQNSQNTTESTAGTPSSTSNSNARQRREVNHPPASALANLLEDLSRLNNRFQPYLQNYQQLLRDDPDVSANPIETQQMFSKVSRVLHYLSHAYHSISDLTVNYSLSPPRSLGVQVMPSSQPATVFHTAVPVQAQINLTTGRTGHGSSTTQSTASTNMSSTASATSASTPEATQHNTETTTNTTTTTTANSSASAGTTSSTTGGTNLLSGQSIFSNASSLFGRQSPLMFMEVRPNSITIDSISATVVSQSDLPTTTGTSTATSTTESSQPQSHRGATTNTTPSGSSGPRISQDGGQNALRNFASLSMPLRNMGGLSLFDPCLPCNSYWASPPVRSRRLRSVRRITPMTSAPAGNQDDPVHQVIGGIMATLLHHPHSSTSEVRTSTPRVSRTRSSAQSTNINDRNSISEARRNVLEELQQVERQLNEGNRVRSENNSEHTRPSNTQVSESESRDQSNRQGISNESLNSLLQLVASQAVRGSNNAQQSRIMIGQLSSFLGENNSSGTLPRGQNVLWDLLMNVVHSLTIHDLIEIFVGHPEPLEHIRSNLQEFIQQRILNGQEETNDNLNAAIYNILSQWQELITAASRDANVRPEVNFIETVNNFLRQNLRQLITFVLHPPEGSSFAVFLYTMCRTILSELIVLVMHCVTDGTSSLQQIVQGRIRQYSNYLHPAIQTWITTLTASEINNLIANVTVTPNQIDHYVIHTSNETVTTQESETAVSSTTDVVSCNSNMEHAEEEIIDSEVSQIPNDTTTKSKRNLTNSVKESSPELMETESAIENGELYLEGAASAAGLNCAFSDEDLSGIVIGSESWHSALPREWVPIITRDIRRQRRQATQPPFSDAYLNGMPSKRRKMMSNNTLFNPSGEIHNIIPEALQRAARSVGVQPITSMEELREDAIKDTNLHAAYEEQVKCAVQNRLRNDSDYMPERFPKTEQFFNSE